MSNFSDHQNRRLNRRLPLDCEACIVLADGRRIEAQCIELGVGGMTLQAAYVPREDEVIEVLVRGPEASPLARPPLHGRLEVTRCHALDDGRYEIGGRLAQVLQ